MAAYQSSQLASALFQAQPLWRQYGSRAHQWLSDNKQQALLFCAISEILLGFLCAFSLFTPARSLAQTLVMWNLLRLRYACVCVFVGAGG